MFPGHGGARGLRLSSHTRITHTVTHPHPHPYPPSTMGDRGAEAAALAKQFDYKAVRVWEQEGERGREEKKNTRRAGVARRRRVCALDASPGGAGTVAGRLGAARPMGCLVVSLPSAGSLRSRKCGGGVPSTAGGGGRGAVDLCPRTRMRFTPPSLHHPPTPHPQNSNLVLTADRSHRGPAEPSGAPETLAGRLHRMGDRVRFDAPDGLAERKAKAKAKREAAAKAGGGAGEDWELGGAKRARRVSVTREG